MTTHHGFLVRSNEELTIILSGQCLRKEDIEPLRLASKEYGLKSLVDICKHPIFGPQLRSVDFLATTLHIKGLEERASGVRNYHKTDDIKSMTNRLAEISDYARLSQKYHMCFAVVSDTLSACFKHVFRIRAMPCFPPS